MKPTQFLAVAIICLFSLGSFQPSLCAAGKNVPLFTDPMLERFGLTRAWFNQIQIDPGRHKVLHVIVEGGTLFAVSDDSRLHAIDAETGVSLWVRTFGQKGMVDFEPSANSRMVAVLNGLDLFIFNRKNGKHIFGARLPAVPAAACELSENYVYIPLMNGHLIAFPLEDSQLSPDDAIPTDSGDAASLGANRTPRNEDPALAAIVKSFEEAKKTVFKDPKVPTPEPEVVLRGPLGFPMTCLSFGNVLTKPTLATQRISHDNVGHKEVLTWVTDHGALFAATIEGFSQEKLILRYKVDSMAESFFLDKTRIERREWNKGNEIVARPTANQFNAYRPTTQPGNTTSLVVAGSRGGYVFAVRDEIGKVLWRFAARGPIVERAAIVGRDVFCPTFPTGMHALDIENGEQRWFAAGIQKFVAASEQRLYTLDANKNLVILNAKTGVPISSLSVRAIDKCLFNIETDRIYFVNDSGLIQCLKERRLCGDPQCRGKVDCPHAEKLAKPIQHRLSAQEFAASLKSRNSQRLWWMDEDEDEDENPFGTTPKEMSDEDNEGEMDEDGEGWNFEDDDE